MRPIAHGGLDGAGALGCSQLVHAPLHRLEFRQGDGAVRLAAAAARFLVAAAALMAVPLLVPQVHPLRYLRRELLRSPGLLLRHSATGGRGYGGGGGTVVQGEARKVARDASDALLLILEVLLLRPDDRAGADDPEPCNGLVSGEAQVLHEVDANQSPCTSQPGKAVNRNHTVAPLGDAQERVHNRVRGR